MGLFGKRRDDLAAPLTATEGVAGIALAAAFADGVYAEDEHVGLEAYLEERDLAAEEVDAALRKVDGLARRDGPHAMLEACARALPPEARPDAFRMAADILTADEEFGDVERRFLERLRSVLELDEATARRIVEGLAGRR